VEADQLPVLQGTEARPIEPVRVVPLPVTVVAATGGALVGIATWVLFRVLRRPRRKAALRLGRKGLEVSGSRSFLVDVHMLKR
jgi:hypothetical protein